MAAFFVSWQSLVARIPHASCAALCACWEYQVPIYYLGSLSVLWHFIKVVQGMQEEMDFFLGSLFCFVCFVLMIEVQIVNYFELMVGIDKQT